jgi:uncharacterized membrane protein
MIANHHVYNLLIIAFIMAFVDIFYLSSMASFFNRLLINIQGTPIKLDMFATIIVYICLVFQLYYFVLKNEAQYKTKQGIILDAFLIGLTTYGVYEYTNKAIFKKWTYEATIYDTIWGGVLFGLTSVLYLYVKQFN